MLFRSHSRGSGKLRTSEDYGELFDQVRETIGTKEFYCHFSGIEHRMGDALHYTQIKKSDLNFEPFAEFLNEDGKWLDITIISDSPLLEHDAMFMHLQIDKYRNRMLEKKAREERRKQLAAGSSLTPEELAEREKVEAAARVAATGEKTDEEGAATSALKDGASVESTPVAEGKEVTEGETKVSSEQTQPTTGDDKPTPEEKKSEAKQPTSKEEGDDGFIALDDSDDDDIF